jgi:hypothetical protein
MNKLEGIFRTIPEFTVDIAGSPHPSFSRQRVGGGAGSVPPSEQKSGKTIKSVPQKVEK